MEAPSTSRPHPRHEAVLTTTTFVLFLCLLAACSSDKEEIPNSYDLITDRRGDPSIERTWIEPTVQHVASLSTGKEYTLYNPNAVRIAADGRIYVFDFGDMTIKGFTPEGRYVATYGRGRGEGPGQLAMMTDAGVWSDSLVYIVDGRSRRISYLDRRDGTFLRSRTLEKRVFRVERTTDSTEYRVGFGMSDFLVMETPERRRSVSYVTADPIQNILLTGRLHTSGGRAVYVPTYFPVVFTFASDDTTGIAYPTPDYGAVPMPETTTRTINGRKAMRPPDRDVHGESSLHEGVLSIRRPTLSTDSMEFDRYRVHDGIVYRHTARFPVQGDPAVLGLDRLVAVRDTSVHVYSYTHDRF